MTFFVECNSITFFVKYIFAFLIKKNGFIKLCFGKEKKIKDKKKKKEEGKPKKKGKERNWSLKRRCCKEKKEKEEKIKNLKKK